MRDVAVLGAGGWGTALAIHLGRLGRPVKLWGRDAALVTRMREERTNQAYLPGGSFPPLLTPTASLVEAVEATDCVVVAVPSHGVREMLRRAAPFLQPEATIVSGTKGFELGTLNRMSEVIEQEVGPSRRVAVLSGPSFAAELARGAPTAVLVASRYEAVAAMIQEEFRAAYFRVYTSDDVIGVEVGGAMKNVIAIAAGVVEGMGLGPNAMAALITRGLAEISRLASALGGRRETLAGLSGVGDLILTCTGGLSRNHHVGVELGRGRQITEILAGMQAVAEGIKTTEAALEFGRRHQVDLPIAYQMGAVLAGRVQAKVAVDELMGRRQRLESDARGDADEPRLGV
jgi:glycerol-3-phosphate dehydrogenase (NAD(P)+)